MNIDLGGRVALITGGSKGLGLAMANRFAASGADVVIVARDPGALETAANTVREASTSKVEAISCDVRRPDDVEKAYRAAVERLGKVDILVNNAGAHAGGALEAVTEEQWAQDIDLKLMAAVRFCRLAFPDMKARGWGRIINISNVYAKAPSPRSTPTAVTRAAGMALTKALAGEGAAFGVLVNSLVVGIIDSDQHVRAWKSLKGRGEDLTYEAFLERAAQRAAIPLGRVGRAEEFANVACFLASDAASYVTGTNVNVDGGMSPVL